MWTVVYKETVYFDSKNTIKAHLKKIQQIKVLFYLF